jgi:hypothetical protein
MYDIANSKLSVTLWQRSGVRVVDSETARIHTLEFADNAVRPLGLENEFKVYISDPLRSPTSPISVMITDCPWMIQGTQGGCQRHRTLGVSGVHH